MYMNRIKLEEAIKSIEYESIKFYEGDNILVDAFDKSNGKKEDSDFATDISFILYSYISALILFKAQNRQKRINGKKYFDVFFSSIVRKQDEKLKDKAKEEYKKAMNVIDSFFSSENIKMEVLLATLAPLAVLEEINKDKDKSKEIVNAFSKNKITIFNQVILFIRSLYHALLSKKDIDQFKVRPDYQNLSNGIIIYDDKVLIITTWKNAYTLDGFKEVLLDGIDNISNNMPLSNIEEIGVLYLTKGIFAESKI